MTLPLSNADSLRIGNVDFVSPDEIKVLLDIEAPNDVALNTGFPRPFPRINGYALIPNESGFLVTQIEWITIERSQYPKRQGIQDFGIIDLPYPLRKMSLNPLGILKENINESGVSSYEFLRGIEIYPTVGDPVLLPTQTQLKSIVESGSNRRVNIGTSPLAGNAVVSIDPDKLFGRHLAILGNTGSGKSCSTAGIIRWSIESAKKEQSDNANARFIILDPNGEYSTAFKDMSNVRVYGVEKDPDRNIEQLKIPLWLWNSSEWASFTNASSKAQRPTLIQALRTVRDNIDVASMNPANQMKHYLMILQRIISIELSEGNPYRGGGKSKGFKQSIETWKVGISTSENFTDDQNQVIETLQNDFDTFLQSNTTGQAEWPKYPKPAVETLLQAIRQAYISFGGSEMEELPIDADIPKPFNGEDFISSLEANSQLMGTTEYTETLLLRIKTLLSDSKLKNVISSDDGITLENWINDYICSSNTTECSITVIDLSLLPAELIFIITSVIARLTLETLQRYRKVNNGKTLPITLVMEEAHTFIKRYNDTNNETASELCSKVFEKIAREGRKFGLGLVLSSQRPSELYPTVLSQCNSFLLHRISNDRDQELVNKLVPDNLRGLLRELPSLPSQNAILLGWASELPVLVHMNHLKEEYRPKSDDPTYWKSWIEERPSIDWKSVADDWLGN